MIKRFKKAIKKISLNKNKEKDPDAIQIIKTTKDIENIKNKDIKDIKDIKIDDIKDAKDIKEIQSITDLKKAVGDKSDDLSLDKKPIKPKDKANKSNKNNKPLSVKTNYSAKPMPTHPYFTSSYLFATEAVKWGDRGYKEFSQEAYIKNVIAHRAINLISKSAASVPFLLFEVNENNGDRIRCPQHPVMSLLNHPNPKESGKDFLKAIYNYRQIHGNVYILAVKYGNEVAELYNLRPDRVSISSGKGSMPKSYNYTVGRRISKYPIDPVTGVSDVLHIKNFHPLDDWYGLSTVEAAAYSIDQHNQASAWNQALLQNGARPSGALVLQSQDGHQLRLSDDEFDRLRNMIDSCFSGVDSAGRPMILEGGLDWKEMSLSPKDMDFIESKNSSARDIALAFGVPPQLLGIPGDNTYSNLKEARLAMWEQTVIPLVESTVSYLNNWLCRYYGDNLSLEYCLDDVSALASQREKVWDRIRSADFMTINEKRKAVGLEPLDEADCFYVNTRSNTVH